MHSEDTAEKTPALNYTELDRIQKNQRLLELAFVFSKLGMIAFGGPAAHIAMIDDEVVKQRQWMSRERLLDLLGITNLIPGPNSTELAIHIGLERGGFLGLLIAGSCFILPAMLIVWALAVVYTQYQSVPEMGWLLYGIKPAIAAIVLQALWKLGKSAIKNAQTLSVSVAVLVLFYLGVNEIGLLLLAGITITLVNNWRLQTNNDRPSLLMLPLYGSLITSFASQGTRAIATVTNIANTSLLTWGQVFLIFLKIGSVLYGSGYVLLAFLQKELVERSQWLTSQQLLDAIAIGQFTPGPIFTTATFIGYLLAGNLGAIAATIGIFLPAFVIVAIVSPWVEKLRRSRWTSGFLDGVNAASLGLMAVVTWKLTHTALVDWLTLVIAVVSGIAILRWQVNSAWLVLAGGLIGFVASMLK